MGSIDYIAVQEVFNVFNQLGSVTHLRNVDYRDTLAVEEADREYRNRLLDAIRRYRGFNSTERRFFDKHRCNGFLRDEVNKECEKLDIDFRL